MKNFWKLFTASVTGLKSDFFTKRGLTYASALVGFITVSSFVIYIVARPILYQLIQRNLQDSNENGVLKQEAVAALLTELRLFVDIGFIILIVTVCVVSFVLVATMLRAKRNERLLQKKILSDISHQLRTPLSIIKTTSEIALRTSNILTLAEALTTIQGNLKEVNRMTEMLELALAKFQIDVSPFTKFNIAATVLHAISLVQDEANKKFIQLTTLEVVPTVIVGDPMMIENVLLNVLNNAIWYTPDKGTISVRASYSTDSRSYTIRVQDSGVGISESILPFIFDPFFAKRKSQNEHKKTGVGLAVCKQIIEKHKGTLRVTSDSSNGTLVTIQLPVFYHPPDA